MDNTCILVVDDNPEIREIINVLLSGEGFDVQEAENGNQARTLIEKQNFDLIILDIMMPGPSGYQTCRKIRELSNAPILFLSARTKESDKTLGFSSGGDDYLEKPFSYNELINRSKALIRRYQIYKGKNDLTTQTFTPTSNESENFTTYSNMKTPIIQQTSPAWQGLFCLPFISCFLFLCR